MDISEIRAEIDKTDDKIAELFLQRLNLTAAAANFKIENELDMHDTSREQEIINRLSAEVDPRFDIYIKALYSDIFDISRQIQMHLLQISNIDYGLIGKNVTYSYSKWIHHAFGNASYGLYNITAAQIPLLFKKRSFKGLNIDYPFITSVIPYCDNFSENAQKAGYANTLLNKDNVITGYNTEYCGFLKAATDAGISFEGKRVMVFGSGHVSNMVQAVLRDNGASEILTVSRTGTINYRTLYEHNDVDILVNTTPIGMSPNAELCPVELAPFKNLSGVIDMIYTPIETRLLAEARNRNIPTADGLSIFIAKSAFDTELFLGAAPDKNTQLDLYDELLTFAV